MNKPSFVYVIYIASTAEKVFAALTDADMSERYWVGNRAVSDWKVGAPFVLKRKREGGDVTGKVLEVDPPRRLAYSFHPHHDELESEGPSRVTFELEPQEDQVKLTIVHDGFEPGSRVFEQISRGWPLVLSSLKSLIENGRVLRATWYEQEAPRAKAVAGGR
jgi:uncharacterized protein YndB with AHSA1/START domain